MGNENIVQQLRSMVVPIDSLHADPHNARKHDDRNLEAIAHSLSEYGQRMPIVVQRDGMIVRAGNGRMAAARKLGWTHIAAIVVDDDTATAAAYAIADNRTGELASWDWHQLAQTLDELNAEMPSFDAQLLGWNEAELDGLQLASAWDDVEPDRAALQGTRDNVESSTLVLRFNSQQASQLREAAERAGLGDSVDVDCIMDLVKACR